MPEFCKEITDRRYDPKMEEAQWPALEFYRRRRTANVKLLRRPKRLLHRKYLHTCNVLRKTVAEIQLRKECRTVIASNGANEATVNTTRAKLRSQPI